jgi:hypothetical protein
MTRIGLVCFTVLALLAPALAADDGCQKFAWSVASEQAWFAAPDKLVVAVGDALAAVPKAAFTVKLQPAGEAAFALPPERKPRSDRWFGGVLRLPAIDRVGIYQVTLSEDAWIDMVQDGRYARSVGSSGRSDCTGIKKSVRIELNSASVVFQLSGVASESIIVSISAVE